MRLREKLILIGGNNTCGELNKKGKNDKKRYDTKICDTHMVDITIESEAWGHGALAAEGRMEISLDRKTPMVSDCQTESGRLFQI